MLWDGPVGREEGIYRTRRAKCGQRDGGGGEKMMEREGDNDRDKGCSINSVRLQLGRIERDCPYVQATTLSPPNVLMLCMIRVNRIGLDAE